MAQTAQPFETAHQGPLHAAQLDHFGQRLATTSSDGTVRIWDVETRCFVAELRGHSSSVLSVAWAHPMYGPVLASAGEDCQILFWREAAEKEWLEVHRREVKGAVLAIAFCPWEYGLQLAVASSDGHITVFSYHEKQEDEQLWGEESFKAHEGGAFALCWAPATTQSVLESAAVVKSVYDGATARNLKVWPRRLVTGGADCQVRIWRHDTLTGGWADATPKKFLSGEHEDWIRDVAWRPNVGIPSNTIASCAEDGTVVIWMQAMAGQTWEKQWKKNLKASAWQLSWSITGSILAVSTSRNEVLLFTETPDGQWQGVEDFGEQASEDVSALI